MGILVLAMAFGGFGAVLALIAGQSLLTALAIYSGCGMLAVLGIVLSVGTISALQNRKEYPTHTGAIAGN